MSEPAMTAGATSPEGLRRGCFLSEGDPFLGERDLVALREEGRFGHVMRVTHEGSVQRCRRDIRLDGDLAERNRLVDGWYRQ